MPLDAAGVDPRDAASSRAWRRLRRSVQINRCMVQDEAPRGAEVAADRKDFAPGGAVRCLPAAETARVTARDAPTGVSLQTPKPIRRDQCHGRTAAATHVA